MIKLVIIEKYEPKLFENPLTIQDIKGNLKPTLSKVLVARNQKGFTPLQVAIEVGGS